jgi:hypothetical protein
MCNLQFFSFVRKLRPTMIQKIDSKDNLIFNTGIMEYICLDPYIHISYRDIFTDLKNYPGKSISVKCTLYKWNVISPKSFVHNKF